MELLFLLAKKMKFLTRAGFIVLQGLSGALFFYARALIGRRTHGEYDNNSVADIIMVHIMYIIYSSI